MWMFVTGEISLRLIVYSVNVRFLSSRDLRTVWIVVFQGSVEKI